MLALNADDPMVAAIGQRFSAEQVCYYGVETVQYPQRPPADCPVPFPREVMDCPLCQAPLTYNRIFYGHLGHYACSGCNFIRPTPWLSAEQVQVSATHSNVIVSHQNRCWSPLTLTLPGLFNTYNLLAALTAACWLHLPSDRFCEQLSHYRSIFGRSEKRVVNGKTLVILLIKNPIGASEVLNVVSADSTARVLIAINDNDADGRDISWLWDAPFEWLASSPHTIMVSGTRSDDMAVRLRYAGVPTDRITVRHHWLSAFKEALAETHPEETLYVLPTYTALLDLSRFLKSR
jgi:UDP-N-acetylmuramyl tripeptide synthase